MQPREEQQSALALTCRGNAAVVNASTRSRFSGSLERLRRAGVHAGALQSAGTPGKDARRRSRRQKSEDREQKHEKR